MKKFLILSIIFVTIFSCSNSGTDGALLTRKLSERAGKYTYKEDPLI